MGDKSAAATYIHIKIVGLYEPVELIDLRIEKRINDHARLYLTGIIPPEKKDSYINESQSPVEINQTDSSGETAALFKGITTMINVKMVRNIYYLEIEGISHTYELDVKLKRRSFQNKDMQYTQLIEKVIEDYTDVFYIDKAADSSRLEKFIIQYDETDWEFLKRMASHFNTGLVPDITSDKPKFWFGIPEGVKEEKVEKCYYSVMKSVSDFRNSSENYKNGLDEKDFIKYEVEMYKFLNIGDKVILSGINLRICQSITRIKSGMLKHVYTLAAEEGFTQNKKFNNQIQGKSVEGKIIEVEEDKVRIYLDIDKEQKKEEAHWFPYGTFYTAEGNTGWYCMPEPDDKVKLYFPTNKEDEGIVINSIRRKTKGGDKITQPDIKYFRTKFEKEMMFSPKEMVISGKDDKVLIRLHEDTGVEILSDKDVTFKADTDIVIGAKNVEISAGEEIGVVCKASSIKMDGETHIRGTLVKVRC